MGINNATAGIHNVFHATRHGHFFGCGLFCFYHRVIDFIVTFDLNQLLGAVNHLCKEVSVRRTDSTEFRIVVMDREVALI